MNKRQKSTLINFVVVIVITTIAVITMINFKDWVNHSEAMRAMEQLGQKAVAYRKLHGSVSESHLRNIEEDLQGAARIGGLQYRARWIGFDPSLDEILAYTQRNYRSMFLGNGYIVLRLDGRVEWMEKQQFETLLAKQQTLMEAEMMRK